MIAECRRKEIDQEGNKRPMTNKNILTARETMQETDECVEEGPAYSLDLEALTRLDEIVNKVSKLVWYGAIDPAIVADLDESDRQQVLEEMKEIRDEFPDDVEDLTRDRAYYHGRHSGQLDMLHCFFGPLDGSEVEVTADGSPI